MKPDVQTHSCEQGHMVALVCAGWGGIVKPSHVLLGGVRPFGWQGSTPGY